MEASGEKVLIAADYDAPFFDLFKTSYLNRLSEEEMRAVLEEMAKRQGNTQLVEGMREAANQLYDEIDRYLQRCRRQPGGGRRPRVPSVRESIIRVNLLVGGEFQIGDWRLQMADC
jgi:hypothetical protein